MNEQERHEVLHVVYKLMLKGRRRPEMTREWLDLLLSALKIAGYEIYKRKEA